jgi:hypothetical protein
MKTTYTHGDVLIAKINSLPKDLKQLNTNVIQEGEHTGHAHRITSGNFKLFRANDGTMFLDAGTPLSLSHEEHNTGIIESGFYRIGITKEYDYETNELRNVLD